MPVIMAVWCHCSTMRKTFWECYPEHCLADAGYRQKEDLQTLEEKGMDGYVSLRREGIKTGEIDASRYPAAARMAERLATAAGRSVYVQRKCLVEAVNVCIKHTLGFRRVSLRGLNAVHRKSRPYPVRYWMHLLRVACDSARQKWLFRILLLLRPLRQCHRHSFRAGEPPVVSC